MSRLAPPVSASFAFRRDDRSESTYLVQLKYQTIRAVEVDGRPIAQAALDSGLSRPTIYEARENFRQEGIEGLLPEKRGPKNPRKLKPEVLLICHTFVSFDFGPEGYVCISIETRMTKGQLYSALAGLYRQFALYYVIGDERDIVRLRTNYRLEDVYLYHLIPATPERARALFLDYVQSANELRDRPQWYNELLSNCTTNVRLHIKDIGSAPPGTGNSF